MNRHGDRHERHGEPHPELSDSQRARGLDVDELERVFSENDRDRTPTRISATGSYHCQQRTSSATARTRRTASTILQTMRRSSARKNVRNQRHGHAGTHPEHRRRADQRHPDHRVDRELVDPKDRGSRGAGHDVEQNEQDERGGEDSEDAASRCSGSQFEIRTIQRMTAERRAGALASRPRRGLPRSRPPNA